MKHRMLLFAVYALSLAGSVSAQIVRYPQIPEPEEYPYGFGVSPRYRVLVKPENDATPWDTALHEVVTYYNAADYPSDLPTYEDKSSMMAEYRGKRVHFANVDTDEPLRIRVEVIDGTTIQEMSLLPSRLWLGYDNQLVQTSNSIEFRLAPYADGSKYVLWEVNPPTTTPVLNNGLVIALNPISQIPSGNDVYVFEPGVHSVEHPLMGDSGNLYGVINVTSSSPYKTFYIPADCMVSGRFFINKNGVKVMGRGIIEGTKWWWKQNHAEDWGSTEGKALVNAKSDNVTYEGITTIHPYNFNYVGARYNYNLKAFGWRFSSDGFHRPSGGIVKDCFGNCCDDGVYVTQAITERSVFWQRGNGSPFQVGWGNAAGSSHGGGRVFECDVTRSESKGERTNNAVFSSVYSDTTNDISDVEFRDIRIDGPHAQLIKYTNAGSTAHFSNFKWIDVWVEQENHIIGTTNYYDNVLTPDGTFDNFLFKNVIYGGKLCKNASDLDLVTNSNVTNVIFEWDIYSEPMLIAHYAFDGNTQDESVNQKHGMLIGTAAYETGMTDLSIELDGQSYVEIPTLYGIPGGQSRTTCAWVRAELPLDYGVFLSWGASDIGNAWMCAVSPSGQLSVGVYGGIVLGTQIVTDGDWHHVAAVLDGDQNSDGRLWLEDIQLYVDGKPDPLSQVVLQTAEPGPVINTVVGDPMTIGVRNYGTGHPYSISYYYSGNLDDVKIYNYALSASEIAEMGKPAAPDVDIVPDGVIDMADMAALFEQWMETQCYSKNLCQMTDLNVDRTVDFGDFSILAELWQVGQDPWAGLDIGSPLPGGYSVEEDVVTVTGGGSDFWNESDNFYYCYQPFSGDGTITARIVLHDGYADEAYAIAGVMIRESLDANSTHATMGVRPPSPIGLGSVFRRRVTTGGSTTQENPKDYISAPYWVRLTRAGNLFTGELSADGVTWQQAGTATIDMVTDVYVGFAICPHDAAGLCTAVFDNVTIE